MSIKTINMTANQVTMFERKEVDIKKGFFESIFDWFMKTKQVPVYQYELMVTLDTSPSVGDIIQVRYKKGLIIRQHIMKVVDKSHYFVKLISTDVDPEQITRDQFVTANYTVIQRNFPQSRASRY